jgi:hypothetical protein
MFLYWMLLIEVSRAREPIAQPPLMLQYISSTKMFSAGLYATISIVSNIALGGRPCLYGYAKTGIPSL